MQKRRGVCLFEYFFLDVFFVFAHSATFLRVYDAMNEMEQVPKPAKAHSVRECVAMWHEVALWISSTESNMTRLPHDHLINWIDDAYD